jgi:thiol-disulfide isomerase/thioredoxin
MNHTQDFINGFTEIIDFGKVFSVFFARKRLFLAWLILVLLHTKSIAGDSIVVQGQFEGNTKYAKVLMKKFEVGSFPVGVANIEKEHFSITLPPDIAPGVYRFQYAMTEGEKYLDIIINGNEKRIQFTQKANDDRAMPVFTASEENKKWYAYLKENGEQLIRIQWLNQFINGYPLYNSNVVSAAEKEWNMEKALYEQQFQKIKTEMKGTWAYDMVVNRPFYFSDPKKDLRIQDFEKREHFWDGFDANNPQLINTPLYTDHILNYIRYWMNPEMQFGKEEMNAGFKKSVDTIMQKFRGNEETKKFALQYLQLGFKEIGNEEVLQYIDEKYQEIAAQCKDEANKSAFEKRMIGYATMKAGMQAPNIVFDSKKTLYDIKSEQTIVVFWASWCTHCMEMMPKVNDWAKDNPNTKVVAISLDEDQEAYQKTIKMLPNIFHNCDFKKWDSKAVSDYFVYGTPTFIVLDPKKNIVGKYASWEDTVSKNFNNKKL